jgi:hypothetical protein
MPSTFAADCGRVTGNPQVDRSKVDFLVLIARCPMDYFRMPTIYPERRKGSILRLNE